MAKLLIEDVHINNDSDIISGENLNEYKGYFHNEEEPEERYYEWGAHFPYQLLFEKLDSLKKTLSPGRIPTAKVGGSPEKPFRKVQENKPKATRNTLFGGGRGVMMKLKQAPLNVTENTVGCASFIVNNIKSRNLDIQRQDINMPQTNIVRVTYSKKLTYKQDTTKKTDKSGVNIYTSYNDTLGGIFSKNNSNSKNKALENKLSTEKPVMLMARGKYGIFNIRHDAIELSVAGKAVNGGSKKIDLKYAKNIITTYNTKVRSTSGHSSSVKQKADIKKQQSDKTTTTTNKPSDPYRYMTASIDKMDDKDDPGLKLISSKNIAVVVTPNKTQVGIKSKEKDVSTKSFEINMKPLNDLINQGSKSRNVRNNLINNKSSLFSSEKATSQYSASYNNKNHIYTQIISKGTTAAVGVIKPTGSKANSNSKSRIASSTTKKTPNKMQKSYQTNSIRTSQKVIPTNDAVSKHNDAIPLHTTSGEDPQRTTAKSNFSVFLNKNVLKSTTQANKGKIYVNFVDCKVNKIQIFSKADSSKLKTKSNSITSNVSNGVSNSNTSKTALSKTKVMNVSYLKKNEHSTSVKNDGRSGVSNQPK
jgi:hypothetical protein